MNDSNGKNRVLLVSVLKSSDNLTLNEFQDDIIELKNLCEACEMEVIESITQNLDFINPKTYVGSGKIEEIRMMRDSYDIDTIVCNDELSPSQIEALTDALEIEVFDRTYVILEIFKRRARTREAFLQVEIASLKYYLPRLKGLRKGLSRQGGGRNKGKGETQLELDRRKIEARISLMSDELEELKKNRAMQREKRKKNNMFSVSLVGYTNSGKSTTMNAILSMSNAKDEKEVFTKDMLFATLETSTRYINIKNNMDFLLTDTVGFINKLPHSLVEAFKSTLEEISESDLIVHVVDSTNEHYMDQIKTTKEVLDEIGANNINTIYAFNKQDNIEGYFYIPADYENAIRYSAKTKVGLDDLVKKIESEILSSYHLVSLKLPYDKNDVVANIKANAKIKNIKYEDYIYIEAYLSDYLYNYLDKYIIK